MTVRPRPGPAVLVALVLALSAPAPATESSTVVEEDCHGLSTAFAVPIENVAALVPSPFTLALDAQGRATISVGVVRCALVSVGDSTPRPTVFATLRLPVSDPASTLDPESGENFNDYQRWFVTDNPDVAAAWRDVHATVVHVPGLRWSLDPVTGAFSFDAPSPTPSPFRIEATLGPTVPPGIDVVGDVWEVVRGGVMKVADVLPGFQPGVATGRVIPAPGSELAEMFCDDTDGIFPSSGDPLTGLVLHIDHAAYRLDVLKPVKTGRPGQIRCEGEA